jgi:hypothetical protein
MQFKDVKIDELFTDYHGCEVLIKTSNLLSAVYDVEHRRIYKGRNGQIEFEFPQDYDIELFEHEA